MGTEEKLRRIALRTARNLLEELKVDINHEKYAVTFMNYSLKFIINLKK